MSRQPHPLSLLLAPVVLAACTHAALPPDTPCPSAPAPSSHPPALPDEYEGCKRVRITGAGALDARDLAEARASAWLWPEPCGQVSGWAGISMAMSRQAAAFSRDGARFLACGVSGDVPCVVEDLARGRIVERIGSAWPDGLDGTPVTETAPVKTLLRRLDAPAREGSLPFPDDLRASWKIAPDGRALEITLLALATGDELVAARFPGPSGTGNAPIVLEGATASPDGTHFEAHVFTEMGGSGYQIAVVNVYADAAALFREAARHGGDAARLAEKAREAEARGSKWAPTFVFPGEYTTGAP